MREKIFIKMKNSKQFIFIIISLIVQGLVIKGINLEYYSYPFLVGIPITYNFESHNLFLLQWYIPVYFIIQFFSGQLQELFHGYGTILIVRNYNKLKLLVKLVIKIFLNMALIVVLEVIISSFTIKKVENLNLSQIIIMILLHYLTFITLIFAELFLELFFEPHISSLYVNVFVVFSIIFANFIVIWNYPKWINYLLIPNYGLAYRNGIISNKEYVVANDIAIVILILCILVLFFSIFKNIKKRDIV